MEAKRKGSMSEVKHTTIRNEKLFCLNCGGEHKIIYPISVDELVSKTDAFNVLHKDCPKTWTEPEADQSQSVIKRANWWVTNGKTGLSSITMWGCLMGVDKFPINHPHDPSDFSRCYQLLVVVPEWKASLFRLKRLSPAWNNLVENWDKLTEMLEENRRTNWKEYKRIGMYEFMQKLINK